MPDELDFGIRKLVRSKVWFQINHQNEEYMPDPVEVSIGRLLTTHGLKLSAAESCTGGLLADRITNIPSSSVYFLGGVVAYAYEAKVKLLGVSWDTLKAHGAVSRETVLEMARGARDLFESDLA